MGMLKKSDNTVSRRQEIGRGLRLAVDQHGERMDNPVTVHDINELTVVTDESYTEFVTGLQKEIAESLSARPRKASVEFFMGKVVHDRPTARSTNVRQAARRSSSQHLTGTTTSTTTHAPDRQVARDATSSQMPSLRAGSKPYRLPGGRTRRLALPRHAQADRRPQAEADPAQRGELRQEASSRNCGVASTTRPCTKSSSTRPS